MFEIQYKTKSDTLIFGGGDNPILNITSISGFGMPAKNYTTIEFASGSGTILVGEKDMHRTMTISGTIRGDKFCRINTYKILHQNGELYCIFDEVRRKISCRCTKMEDFIRIGKSDIFTFTLQLVADYPYFTDFKETVFPLYSVKNLVTAYFTLPCVFTERISKATINNYGDKIVYPKLIINNIGETDNTSGQVIIENTTINQTITIDHVTSNNEIITIDLETRRIKSSICGNITNLISNDTDLSKFYLDLGANIIIFTNTSQGQQLNVTTVYSPEYLTAVI